MNPHSLTRSCVLLLVLLSATLASAETSPRRYSVRQTESSFKPNLCEGCVLIGGSASFTYTPESTTTSGNATAEVLQATTFGFTVPFRYFFSDRLGLGGTLSYTHTSTSSNINPAQGLTTNQVGIGPALRYYFWEQDRLATYFDLGATLSFDDTSNLGIWNAVGSLGLDYFITSSVAFGPAIGVTHSFGHDFPILPITTFSLAGNFTIFL